MGKYDFIKEGNVLFWHDPDNGLSDGVYQVVSVPKVIEDDSIILIAASGSEAEVYPTELSPINSGRSYKKAFLRWKAEREADGKMFYDRLSEVMKTDSEMKVGDMVVFRNDVGLVFGPYEETDNMYILTMIVIGSQNVPKICCLFRKEVSYDKG